MKYRHSHHAGNFADVHKHVTLLALLEALKRKDKGFLYLETHAGRGSYDSGAEAQHGIGRLAEASPAAEELRHYSNAIASFRKTQGRTQAYPGSPLLAAEFLRPQDRAVFIELQPPEARALEQSLGPHSRSHVECDDGFARLKAHLPPAERRGLTFIDPPYEETRQDFERVRAAVAEALHRFETGVVAAWYPIKQESDTAAWLATLGASLSREALACELWLYPRDSRVALNGSGLLIVNPPYQLAERMRTWLPELHVLLDPDRLGGSSVRALS